MLQSKGGASVLIIYHSDYPKIKANAREVAEEIQSAFDHDEAKPDSIQKKTDDPLHGKIDGSTAKRKLIQYSRRKFKTKQSCFSIASTVRESHEKLKNVSAVLSGDHDIHVSKDELDTDNFRSDCALSRGSASAAISPTHPEIQNAEAPICPSLNTSVSEICGKESQNCQDKGYSGSPTYGIDGNVDGFGSNQITEAIVIDSKCNSLDSDGEGYHITNISLRAKATATVELFYLLHWEYAKELHNEMVLDSTKQSQIQNENRANEEPVSSYVAKTKEMEIQPICRSDEELSVSIQECSKTEKKTHGRENEYGSEVDLSQDNGELESYDLNTTVPRSNAEKQKKRKMEHTAKNQFDCNDFIGSPCERLRPRTGKIAT
ncbi:unnamed protein product [Trifolium pratense]|uniref:Uncharacterized protein n=1 Tax=Trifolium pratense TaxID=57577 RepID=A0ACB0IEV0_TRIPR|nr:unnamed protein product [Trifolium pratense]